MDELVATGKVRFWGVSLKTRDSAEVCRQTIAWPSAASIQLVYNLSLLAFLVQLWLIDHDGPTDRRDAFGAVAGVVAVASSGFGPFFIIGILFFTVIRRRWRAALIATVPMGLASAWWTDDNFIYTYVCAQELFTGTLSASLFALLMGVAWPVVAASQFTAYMALLNLGRSLGGKLAGPLTDALGTAGTFIGLGSFQIAVIFLLLPIDPHQNRRELGEGEI